MSDTEKTVTKKSSPAKSPLAQWVGEKIYKSQAAVAEQADLGEKMAVLNDFGLLFQGAEEALRAAGVDEAMLKPVVAARGVNEADLAAIERRLELEEMLG